MNSLKVSPLQKSHLVFNFSPPIIYIPTKMPIRRGKDAQGPYYQWGDRKKYYYRSNDPKSRQDAKKKATKQAQAIYATGWRKNKN